MSPLCAESKYIFSLTQCKGFDLIKKQKDSFTPDVS